MSLPEDQHEGDEGELLPIEELPDQAELMTFEPVDPACWSLARSVITVPVRIAATGYLYVLRELRAIAS